MVHIKSLCKLVTLVCVPLLTSCGQRHTANTFEQRAQELSDSVFTHFYNSQRQVFAETYPLALDKKATYTASDLAQTEAGKTVAYLWPSSGMLSASIALAELHDSPNTQGNIDRVLDVLKQYRDTFRLPTAYTSFLVKATTSDRFYDDNMWIAQDLIDLSGLRKDKKYLKEAKVVWDFILSGKDDQLGGGIYWCEQLRKTKNTCSNAPAAVAALSLYESTNKEAYLKEAQKLYFWNLLKLQDPEDGLMWDHINVTGEKPGAIDSAKYSYNTGEMILAATKLYKITHDEQFLTQAEKMAESASKYFFRVNKTDSISRGRILKRNNIWFAAVLLRGYEALYEVTRDPRYVQIYVRSLNYAWEHARSAQGLLADDVTGLHPQAHYWILTQAAYIEMLARLAKYPAIHELETTY